jgi:hypothetical protein
VSFHYGSKLVEIELIAVELIDNRRSVRIHRQDVNFLLGTGRVGLPAVEQVAGEDRAEDDPVGMACLPASDRPTHPVTVLFNVEILRSGNGEILRLQGVDIRNAIHRQVKRHLLQVIVQRGLIDAAPQVGHPHLGLRGNRGRVFDVVFQDFIPVHPRDKHHTRTIAGFQATDHLDREGSRRGWHRLTGCKRKGAGRGEQEKTRKQNDDGLDVFRHFILRLLRAHPADPGKIRIN